MIALTATIPLLLLAAPSAPDLAQQPSEKQAWEEVREDKNIQYSPWDEVRGDENIQFNRWEQVRGDKNIQYSPRKASEPTEPPDWLKSFLEGVGKFFGIIASWLIGSWYWMKWALLALAVATVLYVLWRLYDARQPRLKAEYDPHWTPSEADAQALLGDADALAAQGDYDRATHLLLLRSIEQISAARPDLVEPSSTARELAVLPVLPEQARRAFSAISERVERSLFAMRRLSRTDWEKARAAYADFALDTMPQRGAERAG